MVNVIDFYLDEAKPTDVQTLVTKSPTLAGKDEAMIQGFVAEALRAWFPTGFSSLLTTEC